MGAHLWVVARLGTRMHAGIASKQGMDAGDGGGSRAGQRADAKSRTPIYIHPSASGDATADGLCPAGHLRLCCYPECLKMQSFICRIPVMLWSPVNVCYVSGACTLPVWSVCAKNGPENVVLQSGAWQFATCNACIVPCDMP